MRQAKLACEFLLASHFRLQLLGFKAYAIGLLDNSDIFKVIHAHPCARVLFYMVICASWGPHKFSIFGESGSSSRLMTQSVIHCDLLAERESTAKTFLRFSIAASAQQMHLLLPILVLYSAIFRRVFLALRPHRSLREPLL